MSLAAVKARFSELVDRVERQQDRVVVTRNGKPAAVLISADDLESLEETLAVMSDRSVAAQIRESQKSIAAGEDGVGIDELRAGLAARRTVVRERPAVAVVVMAPARREFDRLPISVAAAVLETLDAIAGENPRRLGKSLMLEHQGRYSARRGPYRIIYEIDEDDHRSACRDRPTSRRLPPTLTQGPFSR